MAAAEAEFAAFLSHAQTNPDIVGVILAGSRGIGVHVTSESDYDAYVILRDADRLDEYAARFPSAHGDPVEYLLFSLGAFRAHALPGTPTRWNAYTFAHAQPLIDKLDGQIARIASAKAVAGPDEAGEFLDGYLNQYYRSRKNFRAGLEVEGHLDAAESIPWFLDFVFAAHKRVRPFNKWLRWELASYPLDEPWNDSLLQRVEAIVASGAVARQRDLYLDAEAFATLRGLGGVIDGWGRDVLLFRS